MNILNELESKSLGFKIILLGFLLTFMVSQSSSDLVYLKNGKIIEGQVKSAEGNVILIDTPGGLVSMPKEMVDRVQRQASSAEFYNYLIEISSQVRKEDAERALNYLLEHGYSSTHLVYEAPYYKVQVGPYTKEHEAIAAAKEIDKLPVPFASSNKAQVIQSRSGATSTGDTQSNSPVQTNIALSINGAKATADSQQGSYTALKAIDGNSMDPSSRWISQNSPGIHWLIVDFGEPKPFHRIELYTGEEHDSRYIIGSFTVQYWAETEWKDLGGVQNNLVENPVFNFDTIVSPRIRIYIKDSNFVDNAARIFEIKVMSMQQRELTALPTELRIRYEFNLVEPAFLTSEPRELRVKAGATYSIPVRISYDIGTISAFKTILTPDSQDFWTNAKFREYLGASPEQYGTTVSYDTKNNTTDQMITGKGEVTFTIKSRAPEKPGKYQKTLRCNLYNPKSYGVQKANDYQFTLIVE